MHSVIQKCMTGREAKRARTALRLQECGINLTLERGFDGWTMDDLAEAAEVSRRTVFNYFEGKAEVVLGPVIELDPERVTTFVAGGPSGNLLADVLALAADVIEQHTDAVGTEMMAASRNVILGDARLIKLVHERFEAISTMFTDLMRQRDGDDFSAHRARLLSRLVVTIFDNTAERAEAEPERSFADHFDDAVADARAVLA